MTRFFSDDVDADPALAKWVRERLQKGSELEQGPPPTTIMEFCEDVSLNDFEELDGQH